MAKKILSSQTTKKITAKVVGADTNNALEILNGADEVVASITGEGVLSSGGITDSTGVLTGGVLQSGTGGFGVATTFSITDGNGLVVDTSGVRTEVSWTGKTDIAITLLASNLITFVGIDSGGNVIQQGGSFDPADSRATIVLGVLVHVNKTVLDTVNNEQEIAYNPMSSIYDAMQSIGFFNISGNIYSANGVNLNLDKSVGVLFKMGSNYDTDTDNPHQRTLAALTALTFQYRFSNGDNGVTGIAIDPTTLDDGAGGTTALTTNNKWSTQRIYSFTSNNVKIQRGVTEYSSQADAVAGINTEPYITEPSIAANGLLRGWLVMKKDATDLSNAAEALFLAAPKFGEGAGGATGGTVDLQTSYDNSNATPEILTNAVGGALTIRRGSVADTDNVYEGQNGAGTGTFAVTGAGKVTGLDFNGVALTTGGSSTQFLNGGGTYSSLVPTNGGTGFTTYTQGNILYASATNVLSKLAIGSAGAFLRSDATIPGWSTVTLPNSATAGDLIYASSTNNYDNLSVGTNGQVLTLSGGLPTWATPTTGTVTSVSGTADRVTITGTATINPTVDIASTYVGQTSITTLGTISTGTWEGTAISAVKGGTGQTVYAVGDLLYASTTTALSKLSAGTSGFILTSGGAGVAPSWVANTANPLTTKGDIFTYSTVAARLGVGSDGQVLTADSAEATGIKWAAAGGGGGASWTKVTKAYTDFTAAALTESITLFTLAAGEILRGVVIKHTTAFAGTAITAYTLEVGISGDTDLYATPFDVFQTVADTTFGIYQNFDIQDWGSGTTIQLTATSVGGNLSAGTSGAVEVYYLVETVKS